VPFRATRARRACDNGSNGQVISVLIIVFVIIIVIVVVIIAIARPPKKLCASSIINEGANTVVNEFVFAGTTGINIHQVFTRFSPALAATGRACFKAQQVITHGDDRGAIFGQRQLHDHAVCITGNQRRRRVSPLGIAERLGGRELQRHRVGAKVNGRPLILGTEKIGTPNNELTGCCVIVQLNFLDFSVCQQVRGQAQTEAAGNGQFGATPNGKRHF
jgi:hypothetical protein